MPDLAAQATQDPDFYKLSREDRATALGRLDPDFAKQPPEIQQRIITRMEVQYGAKQVGVDPNLAGALSHVESRDNPDAVSPKGARGALQVMPDTQASIPRQALPSGVDPRIGAGLAYMKVLQQQFGDNTLAIGAYNAGPGNMRNAQKKAVAAGGDPTSWEDVAPHLPRETQAYVPQVLQRSGTPTTPSATLTPAPGGAGRSYTPDTLGQKFGQAAARFGKAVVYDGLVFPAAALNRLGYSIGFPGSQSPTDYVDAEKKTAIGQFVGADQLANLPTNTPEGTWGRIEALSEVAEPFYMPTFGTYVAARTWGADEQTARTMEMLVGAGALLEGGVKVAAGLKARQMVRSEKSLAETTVNLFKEKAAAAADHAQAVGTRIKAGLLDAPSATALRDLGADLTAPKGGIVKGATARAAKGVDAAYEAEMTAADTAGLHLPRTSPQYVAMKQTLLDIEDAARPDTVSPTGKAYAGQLSALFEPPKSFLDAKKVLQLRSSGALASELAQDLDNPITYRSLRELHTAMSRESFAPQQYATQRIAEGQRLFNSLHAQLNVALQTMASQVPEVEEASIAAKALAEQRIRLRETAGAVLGTGKRLRTPEDAATKLFGNSTHMLRLMQDSAPTEVEAIQRAGLHHIYGAGATTDGQDFAAALARWKSFPRASRRLFASLGSDEAQATLFKSLGAREPVDLNHPSFVQAERDQDEFLRTASAAQKAAERVPVAEQKAADKVINFQRTGGRGGGTANFMTRRSIITLGIGLGGGALGLHSGNPSTMIASGAFLYLSMHWPKLVRAAIKTPLDSTQGVVMVRTLAGLLNGYYGKMGSKPNREVQAQMPTAQAQAQAPQTSAAPPPEASAAPAATPAP